MRTTRLAAIALAAAALACLAACGSSGSAAQGSGGFQAGQQLSQPLTAPAGTFTSTSGAGSYDLAAHLAGHVTLVYFGYTNCPDVCPTTMATIGAALRTLPPAAARDVQVVFVTSDPARDTVPVMKRWLTNFDSGDANPFLGLTTTVKAVDTYAGKLGVPLYPPVTKNGQYEVDHGAQVLGFGPDGKAGVVWLPDGVTVKQYAADITTLTHESA